ncbi:MAG TPA: PIN domain-containing protein [Candidatus Tyrphobacter sp.]
MRVALDTNVLAYAEGVNGADMQRAALDVICMLPQEAVFLPVQALGELFRVLTWKAGRSAAVARDAILHWCDAFSTIESSRAVILGAADLTEAHRLNFWDAVILNAAAEGDCRLLLSQDMQHGFTWNGVTVVNPFREPRQPLFSALIGGAG